MCNLDTTETRRIKQPQRPSMPRRGLSLYDAALHGKFNKVSERVKTHPHEARIKNSFGYLPLHWLAASQWSRSTEATKSAQNEHFDAIVAVYRAYPEAIGIENDMGRTPLHYAVEYGASEVVVKFLQNPTTTFREDRIGNDMNDDESKLDELTRMKVTDCFNEFDSDNNVGNLKKSPTIDIELGKIVRNIDVKLSLLESATLEENKLVEREKLARFQKFDQVEIACNELHHEFIKNRVSLGNKKDGTNLNMMMKGLSDILDDIRSDQLKADIERRRLRKQLESQVQGLQSDMKCVVDFQSTSLQHEEEKRKEKTKMMRIDVERALQDELLRLKRRSSELSGRSSELSESSYLTAKSNDSNSGRTSSTKANPI